MTRSSPHPVHSTGKSAGLERLVWWHTAIFLLAVTWMFGGRIYWAYLPLAAWGTIGACLTVSILLKTPQRRRRNVLWLLPWGGLNAIILASTLNPSFQEFIFYEQLSVRPIAHRTWLPSSADPVRTLQDLWLFNGLYLSAFNLLIGVRTRRSLRALFLLAVVNGAVLAAFGTIQKMVGSDIFFGLQHSPNPSFFATFIYHNHWGAFALLTSTLGLSLAAHHLRHGTSRDFWHGPVMALLVPILVILISIPLSSSRSTSVLMLLLVLVAFVYAFRTMRRHYRRDSTGRIRASLIMVSIALGSLAVIYYFAKPVIVQRVKDTINQVQRPNHYALVKSQQVYYGETRIKLYRDTLRMISDKPIWGWGYGSYGQVFMRYNSQSTAIARWPALYLDAHSDWMEALAEIGIVGTLLLVGFGAGPLLAARRFAIRHAETGFPLLGCFLLCLYAWVEFPFVNPAVALTFWVTLFGAARIALITEANHTG